jgi:hypothetical protein
MWLGVIYDSQATNRKQGGPIGCLGVIYDSQLARILYTKTPPQTDGNSYILIEKLSKAAFFKNKNLSQGKILAHFVRNSSRIKTLFIIQAIFSCCCSKFRESYMPPAIRIRVNCACTEEDSTAATCTAPAHISM